MPRRTHPAPRAKHPRGHTRAQRTRFIRRRRRQIRELDLWTRELPDNALTRNPFTPCSCALCSGLPAEHRADRRRAERAWRQLERVAW